MLKAVIFDLDNTLIDWDHTEPWEQFQGRRIRNIYDYVHKNVRPLYHTDPDSLFQAYAEQLVKAWRESNQTLVPPRVVDNLKGALAACGVQTESIGEEELIGAYNWQPPQGLRAYPDVLDVLPTLQQAGLQMGIITNASHPMAWRDSELEVTGIRAYFGDCRISAIDVGVLKPDRRIFDHALGLLNIEPEEAVFVGDNLQADVVGAQGVGMYAVWRSNEGKGVPDELDITPDGAITTLHDLLPLLDGWYPDWRGNGHGNGNSAAQG